MLRENYICVALLSAMLAPGPAPADTVHLSSGTGFYVDRDGHILTNAHVVRNCRQITIAGAIGEVDGELVVADESADLALLKTNAIPTQSATLRDGGQPLQMGDKVVVIGYPGTAWRTGQRVAREAQLLAIHGPRNEAKWLQFSDALAPGNSGGPLFDTDAHVIGVVMGKGTLSQYNESSARNDIISTSDLAISLPVVQGFLDANHVLFRSEESGAELSTDGVTDRANAYVVNVQCRVE